MPKVIRIHDREQPVHFNLQDVAERAADSVARARQDAAEIVADANRAASSVRDQAAAEGLRLATMEIERLVEERVQERLARVEPVFAKACNELQTARQDWLIHWEARAVALAIAMARRVLRNELRVQPDVPVALVREALELAAGAAHVRLLLNPEDLRSLAAPLRRVVDELGATQTTVLVADPAIQPGGCRLETEQGSIDQQFEAQLARIAEELN